MDRRQFMGSGLIGLACLTLPKAVLARLESTDKRTTFLVTELIMDKNDNIEDMSYEEIKFNKLKKGDNFFMVNPGEDHFSDRLVEDNEGRSLFKALGDPNKQFVNGKITNVINAEGIK